MKFNSKAHMAQELIAGKRFKDNAGFVIYYDEKLIDPFRCGEDELRDAWCDYNRDIWTEVKPRHIHQDLIDSYEEGQAWQYRYSVDDDWLNVTYSSVFCEPSWKEKTHYRLHPHNEHILAHRNGAKIQAHICGEWVEQVTPDWYTDTQYRIKPDTKVVHEWMYKARFSQKMLVEPLLMTEEEAKEFFDDQPHQKTGRSWETV
jgi:hypothetical protein